MVAELTEIDALPGAKVETASTDGDGDGNSCQGALGMRGHVVQPLERVVVVRLSLLDEMIEDLLHVVTHVRVSVLVDAEGAAGMFHEEMEDASFGNGEGSC